MNVSVVSRSEQESMYLCGLACIALSDFRGALQKSCGKMSGCPKVAVVKTNSVCCWCLFSSHNHSLTMTPGKQYFRSIYVVLEWIYNTTGTQVNCNRWTWGYTGNEQLFPGLSTSILTSPGHAVGIGISWHRGYRRIVILLQLVRRMVMLLQLIHCPLSCWCFNWRKNILTRR